MDEVRPYIEQQPPYTLQVATLPLLELLDMVFILIARPSECPRRA
jgi:hypothetical protein